MIKKLTASVMSAIMTVGLVAAASPTVDVEKQKESSEFTKLVDAMTDDCRMAYAYFRAPQNRDDPNAELRARVESWPEDLRPMVLTICRAYGVGFQEGERGYN